MRCELKNISKHFGTQVVFDDLCFSFSNCGCYLLQGESGSGKTTLLNILAGYEPFEEGVRELPCDVRIACIFQNYELIDAFTVAENIDLYELLYQKQYPKKEEILSLLGLTELMDQYPHECSHGQRQRIGIARALMMDPQIILCDEPTESLDQENKERVMKLLSQLAKEKVVIIASHEIALVEAYHPMIYQLKDHRLYGPNQQEGNALRGTSEPPFLQRSRCDQLIKKLLQQRTKLQTWTLTILSLVILGLMQINFLWFTSDSKDETLNANTIYLKAVTQYVDREKLQEAYPYAQAILPLSLASIEGKYYAAQVVPYVTMEQEFSIIGEPIPKGNEILINQNVAQLWMEKEGCTKEEVIGQMIPICYEWESSLHQLFFQVSGIIEEKDAGSYLQLYYDPLGCREMMEQLTPGSYADLLDTSKTFSIQTSVNTLHTQYEALQKQTSFEVFNIQMERSGNQENEMGIYHIIFVILLVTLMFFEGFYLFYELKKEWSKQIANIAIFHAMQVPITQIQSAYLRSKASIVFTLLLVGSGEILLSFCFVSFSFQQGVSLFLYLGGVGGLIFLALCWYQRQLKETKISGILKEQKDFF